MVAEGLAQRVGGLGAYALWNNHFYGEATVYRSAQQGGPHPPDATAEMTTKGVTPYWRFANQHERGRHYIQMGTYGLSPRPYPPGGAGAPGQFTGPAWGVPD